MSVEVETANLYRGISQALWSQVAKTVAEARSTSMQLGDIVCSRPAGNLQHPDQTIRILARHGNVTKIETESVVAIRGRLRKALSSVTSKKI